MLGAVGGLSQDDADEDRQCDVKLIIDRKETFADNPLHTNFAGALPKWSSMGTVRVATMLKEWNEHPEWFFEMWLYTYNPPFLRPLAAVSDWRDMDRKNKICKAVEHFIIAKGLRYVPRDEVYVRILRPTDFIKKYPDAAEYLKLMRLKCFNELKARGTSGVQCLRTTFGVESEEKWEGWDDYDRDGIEPPKSSKSAKRALDVNNGEGGRRSKSEAGVY